MKGGVSHGGAGGAGPPGAPGAPGAPGVPGVAKVSGVLHLPGPYATFTPYNAGDRVVSNAGYYTAGSTATSGGTPPSGTGVFDDGSILWTYHATLPPEPGSVGISSFEIVANSFAAYGVKVNFAAPFATVGYYVAGSWCGDVSYYYQGTVYPTIPPDSAGQALGSVSLYLMSIYAAPVDISVASSAIKLLVVAN